MNQRIQLTRVVQLKGDFPDVPIDPRVDLAELTEGDDKPFFITLPVAQVGNVARTGHYYDEALVGSLAEQIVSQDGLRGHPDIDPTTMEDRNPFDFQVSEVDWVGKLMVSDTLWAKAYIPPGPTRNYARRTRAKAGRLATSFLMDVETEPVADGRILMKNPALRRIDLAPFDKAAAPVGDGRFKVTAQMGEALPDEPAPPAGAGNSEIEEPMEPNEVIAQMTVAQIAHLPQSVVDKIVADAGVTLTTRLTAVEQERDQARQAVVQMQTALRNRVVDDVVAQVCPLPPVQSEEQKEKRQPLESLLDTFKTALVAQVAAEDTSETITVKATALWAKNYQTVAKALIAQMAGPNALVPGAEPDVTPLAQMLDVGLEMAKAWTGNLRKEPVNG